MRNSFFLLIVMGLVLSSCGQMTSDQSETGEGPTWQEQYDLGIRYLSEGNYEEAIIAFTAAIEIDPKQAPAYIGRGQAYVFSGDTEENLSAAQVDFEAAIKLDKTNTDAWLGLADVYIRRGDYDHALEILRDGLEQTGGNQLISDKIMEIESQSSNLYITDSILQEDELMLSGVHIFGLTIEETIDLLPKSDDPFHHGIELVNLDDYPYYIYGVTKERPSGQGYFGVIDIYQDVDSQYVSHVFYYGKYDNDIFYLDTSIRDISTGESLSSVMTKLGFTASGIQAFKEKKLLEGDYIAYEGGYISFQYPQITFQFNEINKNFSYCSFYFEDDILTIVAISFN